MRIREKNGIMSLSMADSLNYIGFFLLISSVLFTQASSILTSRDAKQKATQLDAVTEDNLQLRAAVSPRIIDQGNLASALSKIQGITYQIISVPDFEARKTGGQLNVALNMTGWKLSRQSVADDNSAMLMSDGILVEKNVGVISKDDLGPSAADVLARELNAMGIKASTFPAGPELSQNSIRIKVGLKPITYFMQKSTGNIKGNVGL